MTIAISFCCAGGCREKSAGSARWSAGSSEATHENLPDRRIPLCPADACLLLVRSPGTREHELSHQAKNQRRIRLRRNRESSREGARETQSSRKRPGGHNRRRHLVRTALCGMPRRPCGGRQEGAEPACRRNSKSRTWGDLLDPDERRRSKGNAGVVEAPRAAAVATRQLH